MNDLLDTNVVSEWTKPRPHAGVTAWLAATCEQYGMTLVTRDTGDFATSGVPTFNPWR